MMVLVAVAVGAGWLYSLGVTLTGGGEVFYEAATVLTAFVLLGHWFEMRARGGANEAIRALLDLAPPMADGDPRRRDPSRCPPPRSSSVTCSWCGPGSKVAVDGVVEEGESDLDESMVTGESLPVHKAPGDDVIGATLNTTGTLRVRATKVGADTALAQIVKLVQEAQNSKAPGQRLADRAAFWLVFVALIGGTGTFLVWSVLAGRPANEAMLFAITVVVITCPDALGLATPTAIMVGTGLGAKRGVLFKNAMALETAARIDTVVMDKTGTLTKGEPEVTDVIADGIDEDRPPRARRGRRARVRAPPRPGHRHRGRAPSRPESSRRGLRERARPRRPRHRRRPARRGRQPRGCWNARGIDLGELARPPHRSWPRAAAPR